MKVYGETVSSLDPRWAAKSGCRTEETGVEATFGSLEIGVNAECVAAADERVPCGNRRCLAGVGGEHVGVVTNNTPGHWTGTQAYEHELWRRLTIILTTHLGLVASIDQLF